MTNKTNQTAAQSEGKSNLPTHVAKVRRGYGKNASYERIGVAWTNEDGALYVKLYGTQVVSNFTLYAMPSGDGGNEDAAAAGE